MGVKGEYIFIHSNIIIFQIGKFFVYILVNFEICYIRLSCIFIYVLYIIYLMDLILLITLCFIYLQARLRS